MRGGEGGEKEREKEREKGGRERVRERKGGTEEEIAGQCKHILNNEIRSEIVNREKREEERQIYIERDRETERQS